MRTKYTEDFEMFWKNWPGRYNPDGPARKVGKRDAFEIWKTMDDEDRQDAISVLERVSYIGTKYLPDAHRWLKRRMWEDCLKT
ncbi:hypothetical protein LCGC14_0600440 [marine sediment metagenome]|uniref:Uncharacterized protein n=1 Tax=marine sediment metagenome TaxID=412755 RepID=A0A0F9UJ45_9ZZZZ